MYVCTRDLSHILDQEAISTTTCAEAYMLPTLARTHELGYVTVNSLLVDDQSLDKNCVRDRTARLLLDLYHIEVDYVTLIRFLGYLDDGVNARAQQG
jgi:hypothetical protein